MTDYDCEPWWIPHLIEQIDLSWKPHVRDSGVLAACSEYSRVCGYAWRYVSCLLRLFFFHAEVRATVASRRRRRRHDFGLQMWITRAVPSFVRVSALCRFIFSPLLYYRFTHELRLPGLRYPPPCPPVSLCETCTLFAPVHCHPIRYYPYYYLGLRCPNGENRRSRWHSWF